MRKTAHLRVIPVMAISLLMLGCNDPTPSKGTRIDLENTSMAVTTIKQKLQIEGCEITVHRVTTASSDSLKDFTIGTAKCPTATVTSTTQNCGKNCYENTLQLAPLARTE